MPATRFTKLDLFKPQLFCYADQETANFTGLFLFTHVKTTSSCVDSLPLEHSISCSLFSPLRPRIAQSSFLLTSYLATPHRIALFDSRILRWIRETATSWTIACSESREKHCHLMLIGQSPVLQLLLGKDRHHILHCHVQMSSVTWSPDM